MPKGYFKTSCEKFLRIIWSVQLFMYICTIMNDNLRRTGRTTRLVDQLIQELFTKGDVVVKDHVDRKMENARMVMTIIKRVSLEHRLVVYFKEFPGEGYRISLNRFEEESC